jgi:hypothetical protein
MKITITIVLFFSLVTFGETQAQSVILEDSIGGRMAQGKFFYNRTNVAANFYEKPTYLVDSVKFFYQRSGDTLIYWTTSGSTPYEKNELKKIKKSKDFGTRLQQGLTLTDGRVVIHELRAVRFLIRNDSLFEEGEIYDIDAREMAAIRDRYDKMRSAEATEQFLEIMRQHRHKTFAAIFCPRFFNDGSRLQEVKDSRTKCPNAVRLSNYWVVDSVRYYELVVSNNCGLSGESKWGYTVSENFDFIRFGGYSSKEIRFLTKEQSKLQELVKD